MEKKMEKTNSFTTRSIQTAASILATNKVELAGYSSEPGQKKFIHLTPRAIGLALYQKLLAGDLQVDAQSAIIWTTKIKTDIFGQREWK